jgi:uncharacterized HAD superfamily protein
MNNMRVAYGVDFDGTICDTASVKTLYLLENHDITVENWQANRTCLNVEYGLGNVEYDRMVECVCTRDSTLSAKPYPKAAESIERLAKQGSVYVVTGRRGNMLSAAVEWMEANCMDEHVQGYFSSKLTNTPKLEICERMRLTHLIEDDEGHFRQMTAPVAGVIIRHGYTTQLPPNNGLRYARNWDDALEHLL